MKRSINKIISIIILISIVISNLPLGVVNAYVVQPSFALSKPSKTTVYAGGSVSYTIAYTDADEIYLTSSYVTLNGFDADIYVSKNGGIRTITLSNIQGESGNKSIGIKSGSAENESGYASSISNSYSFNLVNNNDKDEDNLRPSITISSPNNKKVYEGGTIIYTVRYSDNKGISKINLSQSYITFNGFNAIVHISNEKDRSIITLSNVQGVGENKSIGIRAGAAVDTSGNLTNSISRTESFSIIQKEADKKPTNSAATKPTNKTENNKTNNKTNNKVTNNISNNVSTGTTANSEVTNETKVIKSTPKTTSTCNDNLGVLGDINNNVKNFSASLSSQKENASYVSQNNYVAKNEKTTYVIDYYNGSESAAKGVKIKLKIPYNVDILEINSDGYIKTQTAEETIIEWDKASIQSKGKCRLYVKVKYMQNIPLEESDKISENFYVTLKTEYNSENETTYLRQLFVDTNTNKKATITKYLSAIDNTNSIRPEDKITRAELAKLLVDSGVVQLRKGNNDWTKYKDYEEIPTYARDAVSAVYSTGIIDVFADSEFKPNNPIVRDEFFKIVAKASEYTSNGKLKINEPTFIYADYIDNDDKTLTDNTKYIMELIRQNILERKDTNPDEYILRKEAVEIINALTFRGPYVEDLGANKVKFVDINKDSKYFYNIIAAASTYTYNYTETLHQRILEIK